MVQDVENTVSLGLDRLDSLEIAENIYDEYQNSPSRFLKFEDWLKLELKNARGKNENK